MEAIEPYHTQLQKLLFPVFAHIFLELLIAGQKTKARQFYETNKALFDDDDDVQPVILALQFITNRDEIETSKSIREFRSHKYSISLSEGALHYLMKYLKVMSYMADSTK